MRIVLAVLLVLFSSDLFAVSADSIVLEFKAFTDFAIHLGRLIGFVLFGLSWYAINKHATNPNQYPLSLPLWGMASGLFLQLAGILHSAFYNTITAENKPLDNSFLALDPAAINQMMGSVGADSVLGRMVPPDTMAMIIAVFYFIGVCSFLKGCFLIKDLGNPSAQNQGGSSVGGRVSVHLIAGFIGMHLSLFGCAIERSFGFGLMCVT